MSLTPVTTRCNCKYMPAQIFHVMAIQGTGEQCLLRNRKKQTLAEALLLNFGLVVQLFLGMHHLAADAMNRPPVEMHEQNPQQNAAGGR
jgi:hypothetical protein